MSDNIEHEAADQIRRLLTEDERFTNVSGATAFRHADAKRGWSDAGYFSFERDGQLYFVTVEPAAQAAQVPDDAARAAAGRLRAWIETHHVKKHDSDTLDVDHGPIVEWDYCDWCFDHGLGDEWPCMFVMALARPAAGHGAGGV